MEKSLRFPRALIPASGRQVGNEKGVCARVALKQPNLILKECEEACARGLGVRVRARAKRQNYLDHRPNVRPIP